jgi:UDP-N-acetylglucosamine 2-epimerase (non-hydrolysing)
VRTRGTTCQKIPLYAGDMAASRKVLSVVGARPNMMKIAPIAAALGRRAGEFEHVLVHTGQHYDAEMSQVFFDQLGVADPDYLLAIGSGSHAQQTARVMERLEPVLRSEKPDIVLVPGDVNSTLAAALTAVKLAIPVAHIEAGLRSFDRSMPEEINRVVADAVSEALFIHSPEARDNLLAEGRPDSAIHDVGNTMIDTLVAMRGSIEACGAPERYGLERERYVVATLHRPALVDTKLLGAALSALADLSEQLPVIFPVHPRTRAAIAASGIHVRSDRMLLLEPLGYLEFLSLLSAAAAAITDSGGIQEETTFLGVPCFTLRDATERPVTLHTGTNVLLGLNPERIRDVPEYLSAPTRLPRVPQKWDGKAAERVVDILAEGFLEGGAAIFGRDPRVCV